MTEASFRITVNVEPETQAEPEEWTGEGIAGLVVKAEDERRFTLNVAYPVNKPDVAVAKDGFRDFATPEAVEEAAWNYIQKSRNVGLWHEDGTDGAGTVVESFLWPGEDWVIKSGDSEYTVKKGDWLVGIRWNEDAWQLIKEGKINGVSMQGLAVREEADPSELIGLRS